MNKNRKRFLERKRDKKEFMENVFENITKVKDKEFKDWVENNTDNVWLLWCSMFILLDCKNRKNA